MMRIFQTFVLPDHLIKRHGLSFAAANLSRNLISGGAFNRVYSLIPVNVKGSLEHIDEKGYDVVYSDWRKKGWLLAKLSIFAEQWKIYRKIEGDECVWFYNLNFINVFLFALLKLFKPSVRLNVIVLDFTPADSWKEQNYWFLKFINSADGAIYLSPSPLFKVNNSCVMPGVVPSGGDKSPTVERLEKMFLLSGVISDTISMTRQVLDAFSKNPSCTLHITGKVLEDEDVIKDYAAKHPNIIYHGSLSFEDYLKLLRSVTFQLSTRNPYMPENKCNFPSKIIEALLHNRIVVSTIDYPQLRQLKYVKIDPEDIASGITSIAENLSDYTNYANQSAKTYDMFNALKWKETMENIEKNSNKGR